MTTRRLSRGIRCGREWNPRGPAQVSTCTYSRFSPLFFLFPRICTSPRPRDQGWPSCSMPAGVCFAAAERECPLSSCAGRTGTSPPGQPLRQRNLVMLAHTSRLLGSSSTALLARGSRPTSQACVPCVTPKGGSPFLELHTTVFPRAAVRRSLVEDPPGSRDRFVRKAAETFSQLSPMVGYASLTRWLMSRPWATEKLYRSCGGSSYRKRSIEGTHMRRPMGASLPEAGWSEPVPRKSSPPTFEMPCTSSSAELHAELT
mmetsp:Transcript_86214/g.224916  ORF Transcript_86214/g.224916 Transcript_86214/m.224916 type:complete len:259 (-) Transcript_86214:124-900(-)